MFDWARGRWQGGSYGCFNPRSRAGGRPSLHADGRAFDLALNAHDPSQRVRGDDCLHYLVANHDAFGLQEILWRGRIWTYMRRGEGIRFGVQQADHMDHVHVGIDRPTADTWTVARSGEPASRPTTKPEPPTVKRGPSMGIAEDLAGNWWRVAGADPQSGKPLATYTTTPTAYAMHVSGTPVLIRRSAGTRAVKEFFAGCKVGKKVA